MQQYKAENKYITEVWSQRENMKITNELLHLYLE